jgi:hypothetical protein
VDFDVRALARELPRRFPELTADEVRRFRRELAALDKLRRRWARTGLETVELTRGVALVRPRREGRKYGGRLRGVNWRADTRSHGACPICYKALPHTDFAQRKYHNYMVYKRRGLLQIWARMRAGTHRPWETSNARRAAAGLARRAAVFAEVAPHAARVLGPAGVAARVATYNTHHGYAQFRMWVRVNFGSGKRPYHRKKIDRAAAAPVASAQQGGDA